MTLTPTPVCGPAVISKSVTILEPPNADATAAFSNPNGCAPLTVTFDNKSTGYQVGYEWAINPGTGWSFAPGSNKNSFEPTVIFNAVGTYTVTLTASNVCSTDTWTTAVVVKDKPVITLPNLGPFCQTATLNFSGANTQFNANNGTISSFSWSFPGGMPSSSTSQYPAGIQYSVTTQTTFNVSVTATNECGTGSASTQFIIQVPPTLTMPPNLTLCVNAAPVQLNATPSSGTWSGPGVSPGGQFNPASAGGPGVKTLTYNYGSGVCQAQGTMQVTVVALPVVNAGNDLQACISQTAIMLSGAPAGGSWTSSGSGVVNGTTFNPSQSGAGTFTLTYTFTDANGCTNSDALTMTVHPLPAIAVNDTTYCNTPGLVSLPFVNPSGGAWSGTGVAGNQFNPVGAGGVGTYQATYTYTNPATQCTNSKTINIAVVNPATVNAGADLTVCIDAAPINLNTGASPPGGTWSKTGGGLSGSTFNPAQAGAGVHMLTYSVGAGNCLVQDTRVITVNALPVVSAGADVPVCIDQTALTLNGTPAGGAWTSSGSGVVNGTIFNPAQSGAGTFTLTYTFTDVNGCTNSDALLVTVNPLPAIAVGDTTYCNSPGQVPLPFASPAGGIWSGAGITGNQFDPVGAGGVGAYQATYTYTHPVTQCVNAKTINIAVISPASVNAGADLTVCADAAPIDLNVGATPSGGSWTASGMGLNGGIFTPATAGSGTHVLTYSVGAGNCLVQDTRTIIVNALPTVNAGPDLQVCIDQPGLDLSASPSGGSWSSSNNGVLDGSVFRPTPSGAGNFTLTYTFIDIDGCVNSDALNIQVHPLPVVTAGDTTYCNTPGVVALPFAAPVGGSWTGTGITGNQFDPIGAGGVGTYAATYTYTNPVTQCTNATTINISVISPATVNAGPDTAFCVSVTSVDLNAGATPATGGKWTSTGGGLQGNIFNPSAAGPGTYTLTYSVGVGNCEVKDNLIIEVWPLPVVNAGTDRAACISDTALVLAPSPPNGAWITSGGAVIAGNIFNPSASGAGNYNLTYSFTDSNGCVSADDMRITVHPLPVLTANDTTFCNTPGLVSLPVATPAGGVWAGAGVSNDQFDPVGAGGTGDYPLTYTYTDANSCTNSITVTIHVIDPPAVLAGVDDTICINTGLLQLTGFSPPSGGTWSGPGIINAQTGVFDPVVAGGGLHLLTYGYGAGNCLIKDSIRIFVITAPIEAGPDRAACLDDPLFTLSGFMPAGGAWSGPGIAQASGQFDPQQAMVGAHTLFYQYVDPILGCTFRDSLIFTVHPMPESDFAQPTEICIGEEILFDNLSQSTYKVLWQFGDGATSTLAEPVHTYTDTGTFTIKLVTENEFGCQDSISKSVFVTEPPTAFFTAAPDSGCAVLQVNFFNQTYGYSTNYTWDFGNGQNSDQYDPGQIAFEQGTADTVYYITLSAQNLCATRTWHDSVKVFPWPIAQFGTNLDTICTGETIGFTNITLGNPESFFWDFGNGVTSTDSLPPDVQYFTDTLYRTYTVSLIATNFCGADTATYDVVVKPADVRAFFNVPDDTGCQPYTVAFTNFSTPGATVYWDFGDGNTFTGPNPVHTFTDAGIFKVVQKASSGCGYDSTLAYITVLPAPFVSFTNLPQVCRNDTLQFTNTSVNLSGTIWDFGDGDSSLLYHPAHAWAQSGTYTVRLTGISAENGCPATFSAPVTVLELPEIAFAPDKPDGCMPLTIQFTNQSQGATYFEWDFGDGNTKNGTNVAHTFTADGQYAVTLKGVDLNNCHNDTTFYHITVYPIPSPAFTLQRDRLCGLPVTVDLVNQTPDATGYFWDFGNNTTSVQNNPQVVYTAAGDYPVTLVAENTFGCRDTTQQTFSAYATPVADFAWLPAEGCAPLEVSFENESLDITDALWRFSDGTSSTDLSPVHTFHLPGTYHATLIASHRDVCFDTLSLDNIILVKPSPIANFSFAETLTTPPSGMFSFTDLSIDAAKWNWDFGDGGASEDQNPTHRYFSNGPKTITLVVASPNGCTDDTSRIVIPAGMKGLFIPNAFTPGMSNGEAAVFQPKGVGLKEFEIAVYSSYGQLLWSSTLLQEGRPAEPWDGTYEGRLLPQDVYIWQVKKAVFEDGTIWGGNFDAGSGEGKKVGSVTLIR